MSDQRLHPVGARLLGIYFLVSGLSFLPAAYAARSMIDLTGGPPGSALAWASTAQALVQVAAGVLLLIWKRGLQPGAASVAPREALWLGLKLLGVYFIVSGASDVIWGVMRGGSAPTFTMTNYAKAIAGLFVLGAGVVLWIRAETFSKDAS